MPNIIDDLSALSKEDLAVKKLRLEVAMLQQEYDATQNPANLLQRLSSFFSNNIGPIVTIFALVTALTSPIINYIADEKKAQLITINKSIFNLAGKKDSTLTSAQLIEAATQDPNIISPFLLLNLNDTTTYSIDKEKIREIYTAMYKVNKGLIEKSFLETIIFFFVDDNKTIIEDNLFKNFSHQIEYPDLSDRKKLVNIRLKYIDIIYDCGLQEDKRFTKELDKMKNQETGTFGKDYKIILNVIKNRQQEQQGLKK